MKCLLWRHWFAQLKSSNSNPKREATGKRVTLCFCSQHVYQHTSKWDCTAKIIQAILTSAYIEIPSNLAGDDTSTQHHHDHQQKLRFRKDHRWEVLRCRTSHHQVLGQNTPWEAWGFVFQKCQVQNHFRQRNTNGNTQKGPNCIFAMGTNKRRHIEQKTHWTHGCST